MKARISSAGLVAAALLWALTAAPVTFAVAATPDLAPPGSAPGLLALHTVEQAHLEGSDAAAGEEFGCAVDVDGGTAVVGVWQDDTAPEEAAKDAGSVYVYTQSGTVWNLQAQLAAADPAAGDQFGKSVALAGDTLVVGAWYSHTAEAEDAGSAYVFVRDGASWTQQAKLSAADAAAGDRFGNAVALAGDTLVVGAYADDTSAAGDAGSAYVYMRTGTTWTQQAKLTAADGALSDHFGYSVAVSGDTALVGAGWDDSPAVDGGSAYVFVRSGTSWSQQAKLVAGDPNWSDLFGCAVALSGETALVGAYFAEGASAVHDTGAAYVFARTGASWSQQAKLTAADGARNDHLGYAVALDGETVLAGAPGADTSAVDAGAAYAFTRSGTTWVQQAKLTASDGALGGAFGRAVGLSGDGALVGVPGDDTTAIDSGSARAFWRSDGVWTASVTLDTGADHFGQSVAVDGDTALVGADCDDVAGCDAGSAYVFVRTAGAWALQARLTASDGAAFDHFGCAVALAGDTAVVGAPYDDATAPDAGSAYVFVRDGTSWSQQAKLAAGDGAAVDLFGGAVALSGETALIGARGHDTYEADAGAAYVFTRSGGSWTPQGEHLTAWDGAASDLFGCSVALSGDTALVGAGWDDGEYGGVGVPPEDLGSAYVFTRSAGAWSEQAHLYASAPVRFDYFGAAVALDDGVALIGAFGRDTARFNAGAAFVFTGSGAVWAQQAELTALDANSFDEFGISVALSGGTAVVGARSAGVSQDRPGAAYVFASDGAAWPQQTKLTASDSISGDRFGHAVAIAGDTVAVGAALDHTDAADAGSAFVYLLDGLAPVTSAALDPALNSGGWHDGEVTVRLSATDAGSGVAWTRYRVRGSAAWTPYAGPFAVDRPGAWKYEFQSCDRAGNEEAVGTVAVGIEGAAPTTSVDLLRTANAAGWHNAPVAVALAATDDVSGVAATSFRRSSAGTAWTPYSAPFLVTTQGRSTWEFFSRDVAGHDESVQLLTLSIDQRRPATKAYAAAVKKGRKVRLGYRVNDALPGCGKATVTLKVYKGKKLKKTIKVPGASACNVKRSYSWRCKLAKGRYTVKIYAADIAGNAQSRVGSARLTVR